MKPFILSISLVAILGLAGTLTAADRPPAPGTVAESARAIPVAYDVDVVVVGGSTGAVAAAEAAAKAGARVFLAAPRPYLGEDVCATMRLWLEEGEVPASPLARAIFSAAGEFVATADAALPPAPDAATLLPFKYEASLPSAERHSDTKPPSRLHDGRWAKTETDSVQYDGDVTITCDLGSPQEVKSAEVLVGCRLGDFVADTVTFSTSPDEKAWKNVATVKCDKPVAPITSIVAAIGQKVRYIRFDIKKTDDSKRLLVTEIRIVRPDGAAMPAPKPEPAATPATADKPASPLPRPLYVKKTLDDTLLAAKVDYLFGSYATDVLRDADGRPCGIVMANRSGRQAVLAKVIIDATPRAAVARMAGAEFASYPAGPREFHFVVVAQGEKKAEGLTARKRGTFVKGEGTSPDLVEYTMKVPMADGSFASFARAEQSIRDLLTGQPVQAETDEPFQLPPDPMKSRAAATSLPATALAAPGAWAGTEKLPLDAFRPASVDRVYVLGGCAEIPRDQAEKLLRPLALIDMGARVGAAAAQEAKSLPAVKGARIAGGPVTPAVAKAMAGEVKEFLGGVRPTDKVAATVPSEARGLPVLARYDVVVVGGGTGGAPAGIGAGRGGAKTLLIEYLHELGGVGTAGLISTYYHGYRGGFTKEVPGASSWSPIERAEWWRTTALKAGTDIWMGVLGCGALVENGLVKGVVVATPEGRGVILAKSIIDSTGNADIAAAAGAQTDYMGGDEVAVQGAGLPPRKLGAGYTNTDYMFADDTDTMDFWHLFVYAREKFKDAFDLGQLVDTRERRRIVGDVTITPMDIVLCRTWPDTVVMAKSNFDSHGFTVHPMFFNMPPDHAGLTAYIPYRALLPRGLDGILVTGLAISAQRDAMPVLRMQPDVQNQGYACGRAAAMTKGTSATVRQIDVRELQKHLVETECLPASVLEDKDSMPMPKEKVAEAVAAVTKPDPNLKPNPQDKIDSVVKNRAALAILFAQPKDSIPMLSQAYAAATDPDDKLAYASILAMMGNTTGTETLLEKVRSIKDLDKGWNYTGMGQFGRSVSEYDSYLIALGRTHDPRAVDVILEKLAMLDAKSEFSHHRACAVALEALADPKAAKPLADLLAKPDMTGYATTTLDEARQKAAVGSAIETKPRNYSLREIVLARALYRCGDFSGVGRKILETYAKDLRGQYARHAKAVLEEKK